MGGDEEKRLTLKNLQEFMNTKLDDITTLILSKEEDNVKIHEKIDGLNT